MTLKGGDSRYGPSFSLGNQMLRGLWNAVYIILFWPSPRIFHGWRRSVLRVFGAEVGKGAHVYPGVKIWAPWNLKIGKHAGIADRVILYSMDTIEIGDYSVISQGAHLCGGTHDYNDPGFQLVARPISIGSQAWVCAEAFLHPGVRVANGVVIGARSVITSDAIEPWSIYGGNPGVLIGRRRMIESVVNERG